MEIPLIHMSLPEVIKAISYVGIFAIVFAESGLFFGFFLPGDSLLFTAGLLASQSFFNIYALLIVLAVAAILGDNVGYWFGRTIGKKIYSQKSSRFINKEHIDRTHEFYVRYGSRAIVIGRFVPIVRTFVPILAGVGEMKYKTFFLYNIIGGFLWSVGITLLGYILGASVPNIDSYLLPIILGIIIISFIPVIMEMLKKRSK